MTTNTTSYFENSYVFTCNLDQCEWKPNLNQLTISSKRTGGKFPQTVIVYNSKTDRSRCYEPIGFLDPRYDQDGWDGEQRMYKTTAHTNKAEYLVVYNS